MNQQSAYASKVFGDRKLYKRVHGQQALCAQGVNTIDFAIPYEQVKITALEVTNSEALDYCSFEVFAGANKLNQFGFNVNLPKDFYRHQSPFDADLFLGLTVRITYYSQTQKTIGINYDMDEVK